MCRSPSREIGLEIPFEDFFGFKNQMREGNDFLGDGEARKKAEKTKKADQAKTVGGNGFS